MITDDTLNAIASSAVTRFPIDFDTLAAALESGDRTLIEPIVRERVRYMLNIAYHAGQKSVAARGDAP